MWNGESVVFGVVWVEVCLGSYCEGSTYAEPSALGTSLSCSKNVYAKGGKLVGLPSVPAILLLRLVVSSLFGTNWPKRFCYVGGHVGFVRVEYLYKCKHYGIHKWLALGAILLLLDGEVFPQQRIHSTNRIFNEGPLLFKA